jgi:hypothetical protein
MKLGMKPPKSRAMPPTSEITLCLLPLIQESSAGLPVCAAAADTIAACARFNMWIVDAVKYPPGEKTEFFFYLLEGYEAATLQCKAGVQDFRRTGDWETLRSTLEDVCSKLNQRPAGMPSEKDGVDH